MSEMIVKLNADHVKLKDCEYVQDLVRCEECEYAKDCDRWLYLRMNGIAQRVAKIDFCSYGVRKENE